MHGLWPVRTFQVGVTGQTNELSVTLSLTAGEVFASTGAGSALLFDILDDPALSVSGLTTGFSFHDASTHADGSGTWNSYIACDVCGSGTSPPQDSGPVSFILSVAGGTLAPSSFVTNGNYLFASDIGVPNGSGGLLHWGCRDEQRVDGRPASGRRMASSQRTRGPGGNGAKEARQLSTAAIARFCGNAGYVRRHRGAQADRAVLVQTRSDTRCPVCAQPALLCDQPRPERGNCELSQKRALPIARRFGIQVDSMDENRCLVRRHQRRARRVDRERCADHPGIACSRSRRIRGRHGNRSIAAGG